LLRSPVPFPTAVPVGRAEAAKLEQPYGCSFATLLRSHREGRAEAAELRNSPTFGCQLALRLLRSLATQP